MSNGSRTSIHSELPQSASEQSNSREDSKSAKLQSAKLYAYIIQAVLFFLMLICTVFSQISLVNLTNQLRLHTWIDCSGNATDNDCLNQVDTEDEAEAIAVFWYIVIILMIPNLHTFIKSFMHGVRSQQNLWPSIVSGFVGALVSIIEVWVMCTVIFLGISVLPPGLNLFLLNGVCVLQVLLVIVSMVQQRKSKNEYSEVSGEDTQELPSDQISGSSNEDQDTNQRQSQQLGSLNNDGQDTEQQKLCSTTTFRNIIIILLNVALLIAQVVLLVFLEEKYWKAFTSLLMGMIFFTFFFSINAQKNWMSQLACTQLACNSTYQQADQKHSRTMYKSSLINATVRLICYPFFAYLVFRNMTHHKIDPWCSECTNLQGITLAPFLIQIFTTYGAYWIAWFASAMALRRSIFAALIFSTPVSIAAYYGSAAMKVAAPFFFLNITEHSDIAFIHDPTIQPWYIIGMVFGSLVWITFTFVLIVHCYRYKGKVMALDEDMFMTPYYDSIFFQQHLFLNMKIQRATKPNTGQEAPSKLKMYICLPMYKESAEEMKTLLESVKGFALTAAKKGDGNEYECHIVFDNGVQNAKTTKFSSQLLELIKETTEKDCADAKYETEYGWCCRWKPGFGGIPLIVHLKDPTKVRNKKRWSQVLYMKLIIEHYLKDKSMENAYILTTDGDVSFDYQSVDRLIDRMKSDNKVGCVCARTHPKGSGILYWYQKFDYAIGHWLQKSAEDVLGCVLCCPGCFSLFRCTALKEVLDEYSKPAESGIEFLRRNMGEDRWLCTMLVEKGHRLVYCAISSVKTSCPESFAQFFAQRRRWIPSTIANIASLISKRSVITKQSDYISSLFILYQILNIVSTAISPATVVFMISNGLKSAYGLSETANQALIAFVIILGIVFGLICLFANDKTQIDIAKILTLVFIALMILVLVGLVKEMLHLIPHYHPNNLNCTSVMNNTQKYEECIINSLPPVSLIYLAFFTAIFALTTIFHFSEWTNIFHGLTFFIALPTGYFLLPIYCAANLKNQGWGTREERAKEDKGLKELIKDGWSYMKSCRSGTHSDLEANEGDSNQRADDSSRFTSPTELVETESHTNQAEVDFWKETIKILRTPSQQNARDEETPSTADSEASQSITGVDNSEINQQESQYEARKANTHEEKKIEESLSTLRNTSLAALLVVNLLWILLLYTIEFIEIHDYIEPFGVKTLELVFLSLYALLLFIQFAAMIIHRIITLVHYIGTFSKGTEGVRDVRRPVGAVLILLRYTFRLCS